ncbi:MAG TPA: MFS transporter, partial [Nevskiaceae bacterium]|nr:MFS transporter [Nevskiaceae bacterium]
MTPKKADPYAALRYGEFRSLITATFLITSAILIQEVVIGYELYKITRDPLSLGLVGLAEAVPFIGLALFGGHLADRREKVRLMQLGALGIMLGSVILIFVLRPASREHLTQTAVVGTIYGTIFL